MKKLKDSQDTLMETERLASLGQLIGGIAHNLKTPIMSIAGAAEGISDLVKEYNPKIVLSNRQLYDVFGLDNGLDILKKYFSKVEKKCYDDHLEVDNMDDIANYILSCHGNQTEHISKDYQAFKNFLDRKLSLHPRFYITKDAGMFICQK